MSYNKRLPDVIGIGTRRSGSSWLHKVLNSHKDIGKPENGLHYFSNYHNENIDWYIDKLKGHASKQILLEYSVSYLYPEFISVAAKKMFLEIPEVKLFVCVRNPVRRAYSDYLRSIRMDEFAPKTNFKQAIALDPSIVSRGQYSSLIGEYLKYFPSDRLKVFFYDDLENDAEKFISELSEYLCISNCFDPSTLKRSEAVGKTVRSVLVNKAIRQTKAVVDSLASTIHMEEQWSNWKLRNMPSYEKLLGLTHKVSLGEPDVLKALTTIYKSDIEFLEQYSGRNLEHWYEIE